MPDNGFAYSGSVVHGDNFIGRSREMGFLKDRIAACGGNGSVNHVVGLPRMGKTSLVTECFHLYDKDRMKVEYWDRGLIPVYVSIDSYKTEWSMWNGVASKVKTRLKSFAGERDGAVTEVLQALAEVRDGVDADERFDRLREAIDGLEGYRLILVIDELDRIRQFGDLDDPSSFFAKLRNLSNVHVVTCSRRAISQLGGHDASRGALEDIYVTPFCDEDVREYWDRFAPRFNGLLTEEYKALVRLYAGNHPHLMTEMNCYVMQGGLLAEWNRAGRERRRELEMMFRTMVGGQFENQLRILDEQELKEEAINLVIGYRLPNDEAKIQWLLNYGFVAQVGKAQKLGMFGYDLGPRTAGDNRYVCFSEFTSVYMRNNCSDYITGGNAVAAVEQALRRLIRSRMNTYHPDPFGNNGLEGVDYEENWEMPYRRQLQRSVGQFQVDRLWPDGDRGEMAKVKIILQKRKDNVTDRDTDHIDLISCTTLGELWNVFLKFEWGRFYSQVLDRDNWNLYRSRKEEWYKNCYERILGLRNAYAHLFDEDYSQERIENVEGLCHEICQHVERYFSQNG